MITKKRPFFSIIIPAKNEEKLLPGCLKSVQAQDTALPWELIVVDSSSNDLSRKIARKHGAKVIHEKRMGKSIAVQTGAKKATGNILCFTEADCILPPGWLTTIAIHFSLHPHAAALSSIYKYFNSNFFYNLLAMIFLPLTVYGFYLLFGNHSIRGTNTAIPRNQYIKSGGFNPDVKELHDVELGLRLSKLGRIHFVPEMAIFTSDRRVRNRIRKDIREWFPTTYKLLVKKELPSAPTYEDIR